MSKDLAFQENQQYAEEGDITPVLIAGEQPTAKDILIAKLKNRDVRLSYSSLKTLDSPVNFLRYFLEKKDKTKSQSLGSLVDCLVLTPDIFKSTFQVIDACPTTDLQVRFCDEVLRLMNDGKNAIDDVFEQAFKSCYSKGAASSVEHLKPYILAMASKKELVSQDLYDKAKLLADNLLEKDDIQKEFVCIESTQKELDFEYMGWKFKCKLDTYSPQLFHDLKYASDCTVDKFEFDIRKYGYDIQFGLYDIGLEVTGLAKLPVFKFIVFDDKGNYSIITVDRSYILFARRKVEFMINCLEKMIAENAFDKSYDFFRSRTTIYKPNWLKGLDYEIFSDLDEEKV